MPDNGDSLATRWGFFIAYLQEKQTHKQGCVWALSHSPESHQNLPGSTPHPCTEFQQDACDLEGVEGATPQTSLIQLTFKTMTTSNHAQADVTAEDQILELTEDQLEAVEGGGVWPVLIPIMIDAITRL